MSVAWPTRPLRECGRWLSGGTPSRKRPEYWGGDIPWISAKSMGPFELRDAVERVTDLGAQNGTRRVRPGAVLFVVRGMSLAKEFRVGLAINAATFNQDLKAIEPFDDVDSRYLAHCLRASGRKILLDVDAAAHGTKKLKTEFIEAFPVPLPPLAEQKRIAGILDAADALRAKRRESLAQLDTLLQSTFLDMFGDPVTNPMGWEVVALEDVVVRVTDGTHQSPVWSDAGIPFLFVSNIRDRQISFKTSKFISADEHERLTKRCPIEVGDVLYTTVGSYGNPARVRDGMGPFAFQRHIAHIKPKLDVIHPSFLEVMLDSPVGRRQADRLSRGVAQKTLNLRELKSFQVLLPPLSEQHRFATIVESVERQKATQRTHLAELDTLFASLQSRAFRGDL